MYAKNAKAINKGNNNIPLIFERQLSKISIKLTVANIDEHGYEEMKVVMPKLNTLGSFDLVTGKLAVNKDSQKDIEGKVINNHDGTALSNSSFPGEILLEKPYSF
ncbi:hypothetical protein L950_0203905 [Sphingobacterium sp. IITKGP-BTPF85]|nr:hypothetical protein L950_0203905 [Sphingobacterium sp. IITKGP-BTPF85]